MPDSSYQGVAQAEEEGIVKPTRTNSLNSVDEDVAEIVNDADAAVCEIELVSRSPTATALATGANLLKCYMGSGILGLPYAFKQGGILYSVLVMLFLGVVATHCMVLLVHCKRYINKHRGSNPEVVTYGDVATRTAGMWGRIGVDGMLIFTQFGFCCVYIVFLGQNTASYLPDVDWHFVVLMWVPVLVVLSWIRTMSILAFVSLFATAAITSGLVIITVASIINISDIGFSNLDVEWWMVPKTSAVMLGMGIYAFEGIGIVLPCETAMKKPEKFSMVLVITLVISTVNYIAAGLIPYLAFGRSTCSIITTNLEDFAGDHTGWSAVSDIVTISLIIAIAGTFPLQLFVVSDILEELLFKSGQCNVMRRYPLISQCAFRAVLVVLAAGVAIAIPDFGLLVSLIGSLGSSSLQFIFPALFAIILQRKELGWLLLALYGTYVCFGLGAGILGTVQTVIEMIEGSDSC